ncbi:MAG: PepSY-like domain-containing protein [Bacteroidaceae bacterium]|nr:PepSY-like domain-containing protein [Bacteroidaceae bacterium]
MKKFLLTLACVLTLVTNACADNYQPVDRSQLPEKAQNFLTTYFPEAKISLARKEFDVMELSYDVIFTDGIKVEFDRKGNWTEVDCLTHPIPSGIVPESINKVISTHYPEAKITKIERNHREVEVKLDNRVEFTFNKKMQLIDID